MCTAQRSAQPCHARVSILRLGGSNHSGSDLDCKDARNTCRWQIATHLHLSDNDRTCVSIKFATATPTHHLYVSHDAILTLTTVYVGAFSIRSHMCCICVKRCSLTLTCCCDVVWTHLARVLSQITTGTVLSDGVVSVWFSIVYCICCGSCLRSLMLVFFCDGIQA